MKVITYTLVTLFIFLIFYIMGCKSRKSYRIDSSQVKYISILEMNEREIVKEIFIEDSDEVDELVSLVNNNTQFLNKFLPTHKVEIIFKNKSDTLHILIRDRYLKVNPGGTFKMEKSINEILKAIEK